MIENLRFVFSHQNMIIMTSVFLLVIFIVFSIKKFKNIIVQLIIALGCLWWIALVFIYPPNGYNYKIYSYNASLTLDDQKAFGRENIKNNTEEKLNYFRDTKYLDYTGAQHLLYVFLRLLSPSQINTNLYGLGFQIWTIINISFILMLIFYLNGSSHNIIATDKIWPIIIVSFVPSIPYYLVIASWEDKLIFLLLPLLILLLIKYKKYLFTSFLLGFIIAFNGLTLFFLPIYLIFLFREVKKNVWLSVGLILAGLIIALLPFFPESLAGWTNRANRVNTDIPFWFSFYSLLPKDIYFASLNNLFIIAMSLSAILLFVLRKINIVDALIISVSIVIIFSPFNVIARVIPLILLIAILTPKMSRYNWLFLSLFLFSYFLIDNGFETTVITNEKTIIFYIPILYSFIIYIYKRIRYDNIFILSNNI